MRAFPRVFDRYQEITSRSKRQGDLRDIFFLYTSPTWVVYIAEDPSGSNSEGYTGIYSFPFQLPPLLL